MKVTSRLSTFTLQFLRDPKKYYDKTLPVTKDSPPVSNLVDKPKPDPIYKCKNTFIKNISKPLKEHSQLKGVLKDLQNLYSKPPKEAMVHSCEYFTMFYYPPDHILSLFRKSRPAVSITPLRSPVGILNGGVAEANPLVDRIYQKMDFTYFI